MLLGATVFASLPIEHNCKEGIYALSHPNIFPRRLSEPARYYRLGQFFDDEGIGARPVLPLPDDNENLLPPYRRPVSDDPEDQPDQPPRSPRRPRYPLPVPRPPSDEPERPVRPPHKPSPREPVNPPRRPVTPPHKPPVSPIPPGRETNVCYSNGTTEATAVISWIFFALTALWFILEMATTDPKSSAISRAIMGTLTFPLIIAYFSIVFNRWNVYHNL